MVLMTIAECEQWCATHGIDISNRWAPTYQDAPALTTNIYYETFPAYRQVKLGDYLVPTWEEVDFAGAFIWVRRRDTWADYDTAVGDALLTALRPGPDELRRALDERPGHLFSADERMEFHGCFLLARVMSWDALIVPLAENYLVSVDHHGVALVVSQTAEMAAEINKRLTPWREPPASASGPTRE